MAPIGLAMEAAGRHPDIEVEGVAGRGLEQVEDVEMERQPRRAVMALELEGEALPQIFPVEDVRA